MVGADVRISGIVGIGATLNGTKLAGTALTCTTLAGATLTGVMLTGVVLMEVTLTGAGGSSRAGSGVEGGAYSIFLRFEALGIGHLQLQEHQLACLLQPLTIY